MPVPNCPSPEDLQAFAAGDLAGGALERIADHLSDCRDCEVRLQSFDGRTDDLLVGLRHLNGHGSLAAREGCATQAASGPPRAISIDSGQRLAKRLAAGPCRLGRFELLTELGVGSFGYVFRARDTELDRIVALKVQRAGSLAGEDEIERFLREARSAAQLHHPSIVSLYETGRTDEGVCYLVTEYVEGRTLEAALASGRMPCDEAAEHAAQLAEALQYAHQHGVVHRDVKPSNVLLDQEGRPHLMDFGLAKRDSGDMTMTPDGQVVGTPAYMSPEQARGDSHEVDARTDVYSLGVVLYEMLTGERPFQGNRRMLMLQVLEDEPRPPRQLDERIPRDLQTICLKAMARAPARRYASAGEFAADLRRWLRGEAIQARPIGYAERLWRWCRRYPAAAGLFAALTLGSLLGFLYLWRLSESLVEQSALDGVSMQSQMLEEINSLYSDVVERLDPQDIGAPDEGKHYKVPYPASFSIEAGRRISGSQTGMQVRLYSHDPFPWRKDGLPPDAFAERALTQLELNPKQPVYEFTMLGDQPVVRYAVARVMTKSCVDCHNSHPQSPRRDWKEGDVRGALEIIRPLDRDIESTRKRLRGAFLIVGGVAAVLLCVGVLAMMRARPGRAPGRAVSVQRSAVSQRQVL